MSLGVDDFRVDRTSILGNPYEMDKDGHNRDRVCEAYRHWLFCNIKQWMKMKGQGVRKGSWGFIDPLNLIGSPFDTTGLNLAPAWKQFNVAQVENEFTKLCYEATQRDISLICWCFPLVCHADKLRAALIWYHGEVYVKECLKTETTIREFFGG